MRGWKKILGVLSLFLILSCSKKRKKSVEIPDYPKSVLKEELVNYKGVDVVQDEIVVIIGKPEDVESVIADVKAVTGSEPEIVGGRKGKNYTLVQLKIRAQDVEKIRKVAEILSDNPSVVGVSPNFVLSPGAFIPNDSEWSGEVWDEGNPEGKNWALEFVRLPSAWEITRGKKDVKIGIIDWGFNYLHEDIKENVSGVTEAGGYEFLNSRHGTFVAGVIGAKGMNEKGIAGVMFDVSLELCRTDGSIASVIWCIFELKERGVKVINFSGELSWSENPENSEESKVILEFVNSIFRPVFSHIGDILFVQSAGNGGYDSRWAGAGASLKDEFENIIVVGSVSPDGKRSSFSNKNPDIFAPGESIFSTCEEGYCLGSGTSFSAPFVAGTAGLLLSLKDASPIDLKDAIISGSTLSQRFVDGKPVLDVFSVIKEFDASLTSRPTRQPTSQPPEQESLLERFWKGLKGIFFKPSGVGSLKWSYNLGAPSDAPAAVDSSGNIYVGNDNGVLLSLTPSGTLRWSVNIPSLPGSCPCVIKGAPAIAIDDSKLFVACGPNVWALSTADGSVLWGQKTGPIYGSPSVDFSGNVVVITKDGKVVKLNGSDGSILWKLDVGGDIADASPTISPDGYIYVATRGDGKIHKISSDGVLQWSYTVGDVKGGIALSCDGTIYVGTKSGTLYALNPDGTLKWNYNLGAEIKSVPAVDGNIIYVTGGTKLFKVQDSGSLGSLVWSYDSGNIAKWSSPAISDQNMIYFSASNYLYAVTDSGSLQWSYALGGESRSSPVIGPDGTVYITSRDGYIYAIESAGATKDTSWASSRYNEKGWGRSLLCTPELTSLTYSSESFILTWTDVSGRYGFDVFRKVGVGSFSLLAVTTTTTYTDSSLFEGQEHCYKVRATNSVGESKFSNTLCDYAPPKTPTGLDAFSTSATQVQVNWSDNSSVEDNYILQRKVGGGSWTVYQTLPADTSSFLDQSLNEGTQYCYRVSAVVNTPSGPRYSELSNQDCDTTPPFPPESPNAVSQSSTSIKVTWVDASSVEDGFKVERRLFSGGSYTEIADLPANTQQYIDTGLTPATKYCYRIRAYKGSKFSDYSPEVCESTDNPPSSAPAAPSDLTVTDYDSYSVTLTWADNSNNEEWFIIQRKVGASGTYADLASTPANVTQYTDNTVLEAQTYYYRVSAANSSGYSSFSNEVNVTIPLLPPTGVNVSAPNSSQVNITWNDNSTQNTGYSIYRNGSLYATVGDVSSYNDTGVAAEQEYCYILTATGSAPSSPPSSQVCVRVLAAPTGLNATALSSSEIQLSFNDNSAYEDFYQIERRKSGDPTFSLVAEITCSSNPCQYTDTGLLSNTTYEYRVRARKGTKSYSSYSNVANATTLGPSASACVATGGGVFSTGVTWGNLIIYGSKDGIVRAITRDTCTVAWTYNAGKEVWASPATSSSGRVYIGSRSGYIYALNASDGSEIWKCELGGGIISSVAVKESGGTTILYVGSRDRKFYAIQDSGASCSILWVYDTTADCAGQSGRIDSSPLVDPQGNIYFGSSNGYLYSLNQSGALRWKVLVGELLKKPVFSSPAMSCQGKIYVVAKENLYEIDYATGLIERQYTVGTPGSALISSPTVTTDTVFVGGSDGLYAIWITGPSLTLRWKYSTPQPVTTAPAITGNGKVAFGDAGGNFYVLQITGGLDWSGAVATDAILSSPVVTPGSIWFGSEDAGIYRVDIGVIPPEEGKYAYPKFRGDFRNSGWFAPGLCAPWGLTSPYAYPGSVTLTWQTVNAFASSTEVERSPDGSSWSVIANVTPGSATQYTDTTAGEGNVYWYRVRAKNSLGYSGYSDSISVILPPFAPSSLNAQRSTTSPHSIVDLSWTDNSSVEDGFKVQRSEDGSSFTTVATLPADTVSYSDMGLSEVTTYWYRVFAFKGSLQSAYSNTVSITTAPNPPTGAVAVAVDHETISLSWYDNSTKESGFELWRKVGTGLYQAVATLSADTTSYTDTGLTPETTYCYKVRAFADIWSGRIYSSFTDETCATTPPAPPSPPAAPSDLTGYVISSTEVVLSWKDNSGTEDGFKIERSAWSGPYQVVATTPANITTYTDTATTDTRYCYRVKAYNAYGESSPSNVTCHTLIAMPSDLTTGALSTSAIRLTWQDNSTLNTNYEIWYSTDGDSYSLLADIGDVTTYDHTGLSEASKIYYKIRAHANSITYSSFLTPVIGYSKPLAPSSLVVVLTTSTAIKISWQDNSAGEAGYIVQRCTGSGCTPDTNVADLPANSESYIDTGLSPHTTYCYRVSAYVGNAYSDFSNTVCGTTAPPGTISWQIQPGGAIFSSPAIKDGVAYIGSNDGKLYAIETTTGTILWSYATGGAVRSSPAVGCYGEMYFGSDDGYLYSLTGNGTLRWKVQLSSRGAPIVSSPALHPDGTTVYVTVTNHRVYAVDITNGSILWVSNALPDPIRSSPFVSPNGATLYVLAKSTLYAFDTATGTQKWSLPVNCSIDTSPAVTPDGAIYIKGDDTLYKIRDDGSSATVVWSVTVGRGETTPAVAPDGNIYVGGVQGGVVSLVKVSPSGTISGSYNALGIVNSHPAVLTDPSGDTVFFGDSAGQFYAVDPSSMSLRWSVSLGSEIKVGANAWNGVVIVATVNGKIYGISAIGVVPDGQGCPRFQADIFSFGATRSCPVFEEAPDPITAWADSSTRIRIRWTDKYSIEDGFEVWKKQVGSDSDFVLLSTVGENVTDYAHENLPEATTVYYKVRAFSGTEYSSFTTSVSATTFPNEPTGLQTSTVSANSITLVWYDNSLKEEGFIIERRPSSSSSWSTIQQIFTPNVTSYQDSGLEENSEYCYRVMTFINSGDIKSLPSNESCSRTLLETPTSLVATAVGPNQIDLQWQDNSTQETSYEIWRKGPTDTDFVLLTTIPGLSGTGTMNYSDTTVLSNSTYYYKVRATNSVPNWSEFSNEASATTPAQPIPDPPSDLITYTYSSTQINLTWRDNSTNETGFKVMRCVGAGCDPKTGTFAADLTFGDSTTGTEFYEDKGLAEYTTYCYCVSAYNAWGDSACSNTSCSTTFPHAPTELTGTVAPDRITLHFFDNSSVEDGFRVERRLQSGGPYTEIAIIGPKAGTGKVTWEDTTIDPGTDYCYRVRAYKGSLNSLYSNSWCTGLALIAPSDLTASTYAGGVTLNWVDHSTGEDGTEIWRCSGVGCSTFSRVGTAPANITYFIDSGLTEGYYCYIARTYKSPADFSSWSNIACIDLGIVAPSSLLIVQEFSSTVSSSAELTWNDNSSVEENYYVELSEDGSSFTRVATLPANTTGVVISGLEEGKWYWFRVQAANLTTESAYSNVVSFIAPPYIPSDPKVAGGTETDSVLFSWKVNSGKEDGFFIKIREGGSGSYLYVIAPAGSEAYEANLTEGRTWCFSVSSYITEPVSGKIRASGFTSETCSLVLAKPDPVYVESEASVIKVSWTDNSSIEDGYEIQRSENGGPWSTLATVGANTTLYLDGSIAVNTDYCYRVRTYRGTNYSDYSAVKCISTRNSELGYITLGSTGEINIISASAPSSKIFAGTTTGYVYLISLPERRVLANFDAGSPIAGICIKEFEVSATVVVVTQNGNVFKLRESDLGMIRGYSSAGGQSSGCAISDNVYVSFGNALTVLSIADLSPIATATSSYPLIISGPIIAGSKVYYVVKDGSKGRICWKNLDLSGAETCSPQVEISTEISADDSGVWAGTSTGAILFIPHSTGTLYSKILASGETIIGSVNVYNRGAQKLLGVSTASGKFYLVNVISTPPEDTSFDFTVMWQQTVGGPSLFQSDRVTVVDAVGGDIYTYRITDGALISSNTIGASPPKASPISLDEVLVYSEGRNIRFEPGGKPVPYTAWSRSGGDINSKNYYSTEATPPVVVTEQWSYHVPTGSGERYTYATPISYSGSVYAISTSVAFVPTYIFKFTPSGSAAGIYTYGASIVVSNISIGDVDGDPEEDVVVGVIAPGIVGYIHVLDLGLTTVKYSYALPSTLPAVRGVTLYDVVTGDGGRKELIFVAYDWREQRSRLYVLKYNGTTFVTHCIRDFAEQIRSIPLVYGGRIVIGGGYGGGNLYVLDSSCNIQNTVSFAGSLKEGYLTDVDGDSKKDWVGGLTDGANNYAVVVRDVFGAPTTSWILLGSLDGVPAGKNTVRGIVPVDLNGDGRYESGVFVEAGKFEGYSDHISVSVVDLESGVVKWRKKFLGWTSVAPVVGDFDGSSGTKEIVIGLYLGSGGNVLYMVDAGTGVIKAFWPIGLKGDEVVHNYSLSVADIDSDGMLELMVGGNKGGFYVFEFSSNNWSIDVPHFRKDKTLNAVW